MSTVLKYVIAVCLVAAFVAAGVLGTEALVSWSEDSSEQESGRQATRVGIAMPEMRTIEDDVSAVGTLRPVRAVQIVPDVAGRVTEVPVSSGQQVSEGDLLIQLGDRAERAAVAEAEATLSEAEQEYRRFERLEEENAAAEARLEEARAAFLRAEAVLMRAQAALEDRAVNAPFGGTLGVIDTEKGTFLNGSETVTRLSDLSMIEVSVTLPERYFERVTPGQTLEIRTPAYPDETFEGRVTLRAPEIDLGTRSFEIRAEVDNSDGLLVGGMFANSRLVLGSSEGMAIPDDAIISEGLATYVYTVTDGTAARTDIEVGTSLGPLTEVRDGLAMDSRVVIAGWDQLSDGAPVEIDEDVAREGLE